MGSVPWGGGLTQAARAEGSLEGSAFQNDTSDNTINRNANDNGAGATEEAYVAADVHMSHRSAAAVKDPSLTYDAWHADVAASLAAHNVLARKSLSWLLT